MDGWVTIGTRLDSKQLDKDLKNEERRLREYEKEAEKLTTKKAKIEVEVEKYEEAKQKIDEINNQISELEAQQKKLDVTTSEGAAAYREMSDKIAQLWNDAGEYELQVERTNEEYTKTKAELDEINTKIQENVKNQDLVKNNIKQISEKLEQTKNLQNISRGLDNIGNSTSRVIRKVGQWALAIFGIRSAYMAVRQAMSTLSEYNTELANKISNIRLVLATALEPIVNRILSLVITLLSYLNYITKIFFGIDIFARASELSTNKMAKDLASGAKSAKEMKKQLAGFDEMNVLQDNDTSGGGGGGGGAKTPEFDIPEVDVPQWFKDIVDFIEKHKDEILSFLAGLITFLKVAGPLIEAFGLKLGLIKALGIGVAIAGIVYAVQSLLKYLKNPTFENLGKIITGIGIAVTGVAIAFGAWPVALIAALVAVVGLIVTYWDKIKGFFQDKVIGWFENKKESVKKKFGAFGLALFTTAENFIIMIVNIFDGQIKALKELFDGIILFIKGVFTGDWKKALEGLKQIFSGVWNGLKTIVVNVWNFIKATVGNMAHATAEAFSGIIKGAINGVFWFIENLINGFIRDINLVIGLINKIPGVSLGKLRTIHITRLAKGGIINQPGQGVPVGGAVAGERGQEGVIPLTDSQQMALLGQAIGKYITINANITNTMNGRVISRELQKIQNESNFAFNS